MATFPHNLILRLGLKAMGGTEFGGYAPLPAPAAEVRTDGRKMRVYGKCTSETLDRSREIVVADGVDWSEYQNNPICTINHGWRDPEKLIGHARIDGSFAVHKAADGKGWDFGTQFIQTGPQAGRAAEAFALVDTGVLRGVSLGFRFLGAHSQQVQARDGQPALRIDRCTPFEITFLPVPDNPDAVVHVVEKGVNGRRLSQHWLDLLTPMVPKVRFHGFQSQTREKAMPQPMPDPAAGDPTAGGDPSMTQQPAPAATPAQQLPQTKPSIAFLMATEQYLMGLVRFLKNQAGVQDHPLVKGLIPALILHLSQAYRGLAAAHQQIQGEDPSFPNLLGHGGLIVPDPAPAGLGGDPAPAGQPGGQLGFGDGLDGATGQEINAGAIGMGAMDAAAPMGDTGGPAGGPADGSLDDTDLNDLGRSDPGDHGYDDDQSAPLAGGYGDGDADDGSGADDDADGDEPPPAGQPPARKKGFDPATSAQRVLLIREKGLPIAFERARRMLDAHEAGMRRQFQQTDLNVLLWLADNLDSLHASPANLERAKGWCREKAYQGVVPPARPLDPASPEFKAAVKAAITRKLAAAQPPAA